VATSAGDAGIAPTSVVVEVDDMPSETSQSREGLRLLLHEITREETSERAPEALAVLPVGATEQHGPHLPLGTDLLIVEHIARAAATLAQDQIDVLVTPTMPFGSSHHHFPFGGTVSLATESYYRALRDMAASLIRDGFRRIFILNGHGGNHEIIQLVARDLALDHAANLGAASYWDLARPEVIEREPDLAGIFPGHAGITETSLILALRPELVRDARPHRTNEERARTTMAPGRYRAERHGYWHSIDGYTDSPDLAEADRGARLLEIITPAVAEAFVQFAALPLIA
jgi:creatinine amidohydrolase